MDTTPPAAKGGLRVTLPWPGGAAIPRRYTCDGAGTAPLVRVAGAAGRPLAIVMTDPDAPGGTFVHWTRWGTTEGSNSFGRTGYGGPCPPRGDSPHHYVVTAYALRRRLRLPAGSAPGRVLAAIRADSVASGSATGTYAR